MTPDKPDCPECGQTMTDILRVTEERELELRGHYCYDCQTWRDPDFTVDRDGKKHLLNGH